jgi:hypothetical protein
MSANIQAGNVDHKNSALGDYFSGEYHLRLNYYIFLRDSGYFHGAEICIFGASF